MESCDCCGLRVDERALTMVEGVVEGVKKTYFVCRFCEGNYDTEEELLAKCVETEEEIKSGH